MPSLFTSPGTANRAIRTRRYLQHRPVPDLAIPRKRRFNFDRAVLNRVQRDGENRLGCLGLARQGDFRQKANEHQQWECSDMIWATLPALAAIVNQAGKAYKLTKISRVSGRHGECRWKNSLRWFRLPWLENSRFWSGIMILG